jgi:hypothetical protein
MQFKFRLFLLTSLVIFIFGGLLTPYPGLFRVLLVNAIGGGAATLLDPLMLAGWAVSCGYYVYSRRIGQAAAVAVGVALARTILLGIRGEPLSAMFGNFLSISMFGLSLIVLFSLVVDGIVAGYALFTRRTQCLEPSRSDTTFIEHHFTKTFRALPDRFGWSGAATGWRRLGLLLLAPWVIFVAITAGPGILADAAEGMRDAFADNALHIENNSCAEAYGRTCQAQWVVVFRPQCLEAAQLAWDADALNRTARPFYDGMNRSLYLEHRCPRTSHAIGAFFIRAQDEAMSPIYWIWYFLVGVGRVVKPLIFLLALPALLAFLGPRSALSLYRWVRAGFAS